MRHSHSADRGRQRALAVGVAAIAALTLGGCANSHNEAASTPGGHPAATSAVSAPSPAGTAAPTGTPSASAGGKHSARHSSPSETGGTASRPADPLAGKYTPVIRNGRRPHPTITAKPAPFDKTVKYSDGLSLHIDKIRHGVESGYGPGVFHGSPTTQLSVTMTNHTKKAINLDQVVVQMDYGSPSRIAPPVYNNAALDFSGILKPGDSRTATYIFSVPTSQLSDVTMTVDMDSIHVAAMFTGSVQN